MKNIKNGQSAAEQIYQIKDIPGFECLYACDTKGQIWSYYTNKFLSPSKSKRGYLHIVLIKDKKRYDYRVHRLIAMTFLENPENKEQVNHIDGNKMNNCVDNLEWNTIQENCRHRQDNGLGNIEAATIAKYKPIMSINIKTGKTDTYCSLKEAANTLSCTVKGISKVLRGVCKTHKGYRFEYINE